MSQAQIAGARRITDRVKRRSMAPEHRNDGRIATRDGIDHPLLGLVRLAWMRDVAIREQRRVLAASRQTQPAFNLFVKRIERVRLKRPVWGETIGWTKIVQAVSQVLATMQRNSNAPAQPVRAQPYERAILGRVIGIRNIIDEQSRSAWPGITPHLRCLPVPPELAQDALTASHHSMRQNRRKLGIAKCSQGELQTALIRCAPDWHRPSRIEHQRRKPGVCHQRGSKASRGA
ncbi:MAG: hypothetical protein ACKO1N_06255 [Erythrobacter sp.]